MAAGTNSRLYRAKRTFGLQQYPEAFIFKGQVMYVDDYTELPGFDAKTINEDWEQLELYNNFGYIQIRTKE